MASAEREDQLRSRLGATPINRHSTLFRVWAPWRRRVAVEFAIGKETNRTQLKKDQDGYFTGILENCPPDTHYSYVLDNSFARPDPAADFQPNGVHGVSQVIDHSAFRWTDQSWKGINKRELIIYELHVGTFTSQGTFQAAIGRLPELVELGVTALELMPVAQFSGKWNWGYDGVDLFAVQNTYGKPDDLKALIDACHTLGLAVILDVVYNHVGPEGNYLADFGPYFSQKHHSPWGPCFNFDQQQSQHVRRYVKENAISWLNDYHFDGLRLDATHFIQDDSQPHILDELGTAVSELQQDIQRQLHLIAETNVYDEKLLRDNSHRSAYDALWSDCQMHSYYSIGISDFQLTDRHYNGARDLELSLKCGHVYAGCSFRNEMRKREAHEGEQLLLHSLVVATQNHDAVGNHPSGKRIHQLTSPSFQKAAAALTLLYPAIPLLFMGEEFASESPFPFFVDFEQKKIRRAVNKGRRGMFSEELRKECLSPTAAATFERAELPDCTDGDQEMLAWYRELIALRKQGVSAGWLTQENFIADYDTALEVFSISYRCTDGSHVQILSRMSPSGDEKSHAVSISIKGKVLLSSEREVEIVDGKLLLTPNHAVVVRG